jgi:hypothetical protein
MVDALGFKFSFQFLKFLGQIFDLQIAVFLLVRQGRLLRVLIAGVEESGDGDFGL